MVGRVDAVLDDVARDGEEFLAGAFEGFLDAVRREAELAAEAFVGGVGGGGDVVGLEHVPGEGAAAGGELLFEGLEGAFEDGVFPGLVEDLFGGAVGGGFEVAEGGGVEADEGRAAAPFQGMAIADGMEGEVPDGAFDEGAEAAEVRGGALDEGAVEDDVGEELLGEVFGVLVVFGPAASKGPVDGLPVEADEPVEGGLPARGILLAAALEDGPRGEGESGRGVVHV